jgi:hypothetical protein
LRASLDGNDTWNTARFHWKYAVGMNFGSGAPFFNINSVRVDGADQYTAAQWISAIKQFKQSQLTQEKPEVKLSVS